jgi:N-acetylglucosaminyl-diphospho-decaprenol L-rhamnosyltransferase
MNTPELSILIVTYNSANVISQVLLSLAMDCADIAHEVIIVDNASRDGTADLVRQQFPSVKVIRSAQNLGFGQGNNLAAAQASGQVLLLLNPDAIPERGAIAQALADMRRNPQINIAGGRLLGLDGRDQPSARMFPSLLNELLVISGLASRLPKSRFFGRFDRTWANPAESARVDWVPGAFMFIRAEVFRALGGFDPQFFLYYEEVDLCRRAAQCGETVWYLPVRARHVGGMSARTVSESGVASHGSQLTLWRLRSALLYWRKHHGWLGAMTAAGLEWTWHALRVLRNRLPAVPHAVHKRQESRGRMSLVIRAWAETRAGRLSPAQPWTL